MSIAFRPLDGAPVRFALRLSQDLKTQGIDGFYKDGRFWSKDMADNWTIHEVARWEQRAALSRSEQTK